MAKDIGNIIYVLKPKRENSIIKQAEIETETTTNKIKKNQDDQQCSSKIS